jgi:hypothetical protein
VHFLRHHLQDALWAQGEHTLTILERQDAPDYVTLDDDENEWTGSCKESRISNMTSRHNWMPSRTDYAIIIDAESGKQIADFGSPYLSEQECQTNFRLGLAAPKLLTALIACTNYMADDLDESDQVESRIFHQARLAIAQATIARRPA